jgi:hypothetical protein
MHSWRIGDVRITRLQEQEPIWKGTMVLNDATPDNVKREGEWLNAFVDEKGKFRLSIHALLVESEGHRILVDTCVGNDKPRPGFKDWNELHLPFSSGSRRLEYDVGERKVGADFLQGALSDGAARMGPLVAL